jgi:hypothetical protein
MDQEKAKWFLAPFQDAKHLHDWCLAFLDVDFPLGHIDPESNSSPAEAMFEAYNNYYRDLCFEVPGYIWLSSRDSYKTLAESALAIILMVHFGAPIAHLASIQSQSKKAISYVNMFLRKVGPYLKSYGMKTTSESSSKVEIVMPNGSVAYVNVIVCTVQGANSEHVPFMSFDELDTVRFPEAYEEAKLIPARYQDRGPLTVKCSTRKYAFGIMSKEMENIATSGERLLRWNILDVTEKCPPERHLPDLPKVKRFVQKELPLKNLSEEEFSGLPTGEDKNFEMVEAYAGCAQCPLLQVCKTRLAHRPAGDVGGLYKPIPLTIRQFKITSPEMATAQLLCQKPTSAGLVYGRFFDGIYPNTNVISPADAWRMYMSEEPAADVAVDSFVNALIQRGVKFKAGVDWGSTHAFAITVSVVLPGIGWLFVDCYARPGLEFEQMIELAEGVRDRYPIDKWYCDTSAPMFIKAFKRRRMPCPNFTKDVLGGIESVRSQIVDASGNRFLRVVRHERTEYLIKCMQKHAFKLDQAGNPTEDPADDEFKDVADTVRYQAQNLFPVSKKVGRKPSQKYAEYMPSKLPPQSLPYEPAQQNFLDLKIQELTGRSAKTSGQSKNGSIIWDFSGGDDDA